MWLMPIITRILHTKYDLSRIQDIEVIKVSLLLWQQGMLLMSIIQRKLYTQYGLNMT